MDLSHHQVWFVMAQSMADPDRSLHREDWWNTLKNCWKIKRNNNQNGLRYLNTDKIYIYALWWINTCWNFILKEKSVDIIKREAFKGLSGYIWRQLRPWTRHGTLGGPPEYLSPGVPEAYLGCKGINIVKWTRIHWKYSQGGFHMFCYVTTVT